MSGIRKKKAILTSRVACIILAGGQGTRLMPLTLNRSKPAVSFGGRYRLIDIPISNSLNSNMKNIFVISQFFSSGLNSHIQETYHLDHFQGGTLTFLSPEERGTGKIWYKGTADAVRKNVEHLTKLPVDYFLILSGDQLYNMDLEKMAAFAEQKGADLTIAALPVSKEEATRMGLLNIDKHSMIVDFQEKPKDPAIVSLFELKESFIREHNLKNLPSPSFLASMGIYLFKKETLLKLLIEDPREDFGKHLIPTQIQKGKAAAFLHQGYWEDIGTISSFYEANLSLTTNSLGLNLYNEILPIFCQNHHLPGARILHTQLEDSIVCDGAIINAKEVSRSLIGLRSVIKRNTIIRDSLILGNEYYTSLQGEKGEERWFEIGENCTIEKTIIDENVTIGNNVKLINQKKLNHFEGEGIWIREGIIIIPSNSIIPDGFVF